MKKFFIPLVLGLGIIGFTACGGDDNDEPSDPTPKGSFTGHFINTQNGQESEFTSDNVTAVHDTSLFDSHLMITAVGPGGDKIVIRLNDTAETYYNISPFSSNYTLYMNATDTATSQSDDLGSELTSAVQITENGMSDNILKGASPVLSWVLVNPDAEDSPFGVMTDITFSAPITRTGDSGGVGGDASLSATIDGTGFAPSIVMSMGTGNGGLNISGSSMNGNSLAVSIPSGATIGTHQLDGSAGGYMVVYIDGGTSYTNTSGSINITAYNASAETVTGTFSCTVTNPTDPSQTKNITNGTFSVE